MTLTQQAKHAVERPQTPPKNATASKKDRNPSAVPPFTVGDIRRAIPPHCFERSLYLSFGYLLIDCIGVYVLYIVSTYIPYITNDTYGDRMAPFLRHICWTLYWIIQGNIMTGLWVIGHECGHGGFADSSWINDVVGFIVHSALLVPFFSWKISHRRHHSNTGNIDRDEVFVPSVSHMDDPSHDDDGPVQTMIDTIKRLIQCFNYLVLGWPLYLFINASGHQNYPRNKWVNHFMPSSPIFTTPKERFLVILSDLGLLVMVSILVYASQLYTFAHVAYVYLIPYLITNLYLVLITFLQHTDLALPHYDSTEWDWLRGALATIDRDYWICNYFHHHIADTHIVHHLFSNLPHYHAQEATEAVKHLLGSYYRMDRTPITVALWRATRTCNTVKPDVLKKGVYWYDEPQTGGKKEN